MGRGSSVVLVAPCPVPDTGNHAGGDEDDGGVVYGIGSYGEGTRHAEERHGKGGPGERDNVAKDTKLAEVKGSLLDLLAAGKETNGDGGGVGSSQANDTDTGEGVEGGGRAKVEDTEDNLDNHAEHHGVEGNVELVVDLGPPSGTRDGTVTSKGPGASGGGGGATNTAHDGQNDKGEAQAKGTTGGANGTLDDDGCGLGVHNESWDVVGENEDDGDKEEEASKGVDDDGGDHGLGDLDGRLLDFLTHGNDHASGRGSVTGVEETDTERPAIRPAGGGLEVSKDIFGIVTAVLGNGKDGDGDGNDTSKGPEDGSGVEPGEPLVGEGRDGVAQESDSDKDQKHLVGGTFQDTDTGRGLEDVDTADDEEGSTKVDSKSNGDVSDDVEPAADPTSNTTPFGRREHEGLVVYTSSSGINTGDFTKRGGDTENDARDENPSPNDIHWTTTDQGVVEGSSETVGDRGEDEGHEGDLEGRSVSAELRLVTQALEKLIGSGITGRGGGPRAWTLLGFTLGFHVAVAAT